MLCNQVAGDSGGALVAEFTYDFSFSLSPDQVKSLKTVKTKIYSVSWQAPAASGK